MTQLHVYPTGVTHIVRPEDFPVMPVEHVGFTLKPFGFFLGQTLRLTCHMLPMLQASSCAAMAPP